MMRTHQKYTEARLNEFPQAKYRTTGWWEGERLMEYTWIKQEFMDPNWYSIEHYYIQLNKEEKKAAPYCLVEKAKR